MLRKLVSAIYRGLFWTYERGTWQYDIMVALILLFIFLTPRGWFQDKPVSPLPAADIVLLLNDPAQKVYQLRATLLNAKPPETVERSAQRVLEIHTGKSIAIVRVEPAKDSRGQVVSYAVWVREQAAF
ncbi:MAG: hypothetical protein A3J28_10175 [Acidobacteria bacterium RIFCSPLOWO2_12_FULL_60_22]|nr:MAG: hypothetical protein A3J28_10175 [Acidobacteria bacterium RIFCSPLOWO2_12_FULL_60_22]